MNTPETYTTFESIDWSTWTARDRATLLFVIRDHHILLIHKKRGLGKGKINGPGGRIEPGESPRACAIREVQEELCVTAHDPVERGRLYFQFADGYALEGTVFTSHDLTGDPQETHEAIPLWTALHQIPYHRMWADDPLWLPAMLDGLNFSGRFLFDGDTMLGHDVKIMPMEEYRGV